MSRGKLAAQIACIAWPSKMDCPAWGIPVDRCRKGSVLAQKAGTVCHSCYAATGRFRFKNVRAKLERSYEQMFHPLWVPAQVHQICRYDRDRYRWLFSGDLQGRNHLRNIIRVCLETPWVRHWLPTREAEVVRGCQDEIPTNLNVRASANRIDGPKPRWWPTTSRVVTTPTSDLCPTSVEGRTCSDHGCYDCWDAAVESKDYLKH